MVTLPFLVFMEVIKLKRYLDKHQLFGVDLPLGEQRPDMIVVIPCYDEPELLNTLESLERAMSSSLCVEVIVVVNDGEHSDADLVGQNEATFQLLQRWREDRRFSFLLLPIRMKGVRRKHAGVGYARKAGMDMAVWRSAQYGCSYLPLLSLDADTCVASNYFTEIDEVFSDASVAGAIIRFEHSICGDVFDDMVYRAVAQYELHLRYLNQGLLYSAYPHVCHTVGSAFALRVSAYAKHGGMNRRQGGEDFYFIHKLLPHEHFVNVNTTCVFPSSRPSQRVPFGTGPQIRQGVEDGLLLTYHPDVFDILKSFVASVPLLYGADVVFQDLVERFLLGLNYKEKLREIRSNTSDEAAFVKRFFVFFDAFQVVKFLNYAHQECLAKIQVEEAAMLLLQRMSMVPEGDLLSFYRKMEGK